ncbi:MAG: hypothetical protein IMW86_03510 [Hydrogenibacillus sp.]|nr:hypothetical protein [Hydrogenibacillus sp.]
MIGIERLDRSAGAVSVHLGRKVVGSKAMRRLSIVAGLVLIGFALWFGVQALRLLFG